MSTGTVSYPTDAEPPFAALALCGGLSNTGPEMAAWGPFYASRGIVTIITTTLGPDSPDIRATKLLAAVAELKSENTKSGSALFGKLSNRYGTSGYSMGGGGTTLASRRHRRELLVDTSREQELPDQLLPRRAASPGALAPWTPQIA